jgi:excinuclease UvrABC nuclease subunit
MTKRTGKTKPLPQKNLSDVPAQTGVYNLRNRKGDIIHTGLAGADRLKARLQEHLDKCDARGARSYQIRPLSSAAEAIREYRYSVHGRALPARLVSHA